MAVQRGVAWEGVIRVKREGGPGASLLSVNSGGFWVETEVSKGAEFQP